MTESNGKKFYPLPIIGADLSEGNRTPRPVSPSHEEDIEEAGVSTRGRSHRETRHRAQSTSQDRDDEFVSNIRNRSLLRRGPREEDFKEPTTFSVRITLEPYAPEADSFKFNPISFELYDDGPSVPICRSEKQSQHAAILSKGKVRFGSRVVTRRSHAQIWCDDGKVSNPFRTAEVGLSINEGFRARYRIKRWYLVE
jgi:hypothetical protein